MTTWGAFAAAEPAYSPDHAWSFGLDRVLDALESLMRTRQVPA